MVVEFGPPIRVPEELAELYKTNRKDAYQQVGGGIGIMGWGGRGLWMPHIIANM